MDTSKSTRDPLTSKQQMVYDFIVEFIHEHHYSPSIREIGKGLNISSTSTIHTHITTLARKGYIDKNQGTSRCITLVQDEPDTTDIVQENVIPFGQGSYSDTITLPVIGDVAAGSPILADQNITETITLPVSIVGDSGSFLLNVHGESMIEIGINDGDYVVVQEQKTARNGEIVVAIIEDGATVKRFFKEKDHIRLQPENSSMDPIIVQDCAIAGKVIALFRRM